MATSVEREFLPGVPMMASLGFSGYAVSAKFATLAPAGTPEPIVARLNDTVGKFLRAPTALRQLGARRRCLRPGGSISPHVHRRQAALE